MGPRNPASPTRPADDLNKKPLPVVAIHRAWVRLHQQHLAAKFFGKAGRFRFDAPRGEFGVLYAGQDEACAFIEAFGDPLDIRILSYRVLAEYCLSSVRTARPLRLVDLTGPGLRQVGADARLTGGDDYAYSQVWAASLWRHPDQVDGLLYRARHDPSLQAAAVFDRARAVVRTTRLRCLGDDRAGLGRLLDRYGFGLVD